MSEPSFFPGLNNRGFKIKVADLKLDTKLIISKDAYNGKPLIQPKEKDDGDNNNSRIELEISD